ncbi:hypothetical protein [Nonomuraea sp. NPDC049695]|uniref:hypothetical protein n=1 Tax=Nonomuraea sp. NPDC049695 TaxID=3154734 RepID=UPI0034393D50
MLVVSSFIAVVETDSRLIVIGTVNGAMPDGMRARHKPFKKFIDRPEFPPVLDAIRGDVVDAEPPGPAVLAGAGLPQARPGAVRSERKTGSSRT